MKPGARQYTMMAPGTALGGYAPGENGWQVVPAGLVQGNGAYYYYQTKLDLRGLDDLGLQPLSVTLQEGGPIILHSNETSAMVIDVLTTVRPTETNMGDWWVSINIQGNPPGFMMGSAIAYGPQMSPDVQTLNPSQVTWGLWRLFGVNGAFRLAGTDFPTQTISSGYFGQGEVQVPPSVWWTRLVIGDESDTSMGMPSSNLVVYANAHSMTEPEEMTAMMRSVQR
ncbi:MAG TPA: hypothetical protein EYN66_13945 [Myxococcales bacterium]|nr:hypothetical protein [Myxococcales bacterium]